MIDIVSHINHHLMMENMDIKKWIMLILAIAFLGLLSNYIACEYRMRGKYSPEMCKVVTTIVKFIYRLD